MRADGAAPYRLRFRKVLEYIDVHLDEPLTVERLSAVASSSKYHFHRQFSALYALGVYEYVKLVRLRRASYRLAFPEARVIEIALASGYESHEAFSRAFKRCVGQSPSEFRERPAWERWHVAYRPLTDLRSIHMSDVFEPRTVEIVNFERTRIALLEHRGAPARLGDSIRKFIQWRKENDVRPPRSATFNLLYDDPASASPEEFRLGVCAAVERAVPANEQGVVEAEIPPGRCARLRHVGSDDTLGESLRYLYATWLPTSGEELRDDPLFVQRVSFFPDVPEHEAVSDIYLPLR